MEPERIELSCQHIPIKGFCDGQTYLAPGPQPFVSLNPGWKYSLFCKRLKTEFIPSYRNRTYQESWLQYHILYQPAQELGGSRERIWTSDLLDISQASWPDCSTLLYGKDGRQRPLCNSCLACQVYPHLLFGISGPTKVNTSCFDYGNQWRLRMNHTDWWHIGSSTLFDKRHLQAYIQIYRKATLGLYHRLQSLG